MSETEKEITSTPSTTCVICGEDHEQNSIFCLDCWERDVQPHTLLAHDEGIGQATRILREKSCNYFLHKEDSMATLFRDLADDLDKFMLLDHELVDDPVQINKRGD